MDSGLDLGANICPRERADLVIDAVAVCVQPFAYSTDVLVVRRKEAPEILCMPGGTVERGEKARDAVVREAREETGLIIRPKNLGWCGAVHVESRNGGLLTVAVFWTLAPHLYEPGPGMGEPGLDPHWHDWADLADPSKHGRFAGPAMLARVAMGVHVAELQPWAIERAVSMACLSPCSKSKRGVVVLRANGTIVGSGFNHPPGGRACAGTDACRADCGKLCVHAEMSALRDAGSAAGPLEVVHVKVVDGRLVAGGGPSCSPCARDLLDDGRVVAVWLFHVDGWRRYPIADFYETTMRECGLPILLDSMERP
jgi:ADP-ribose pyrophosphatase YjhB (NUDIX family)/deoxycytidylate deaminase